MPSQQGFGSQAFYSNIWNLFCFDISSQNEFQRINMTWVPYYTILQVLVIVTLLIYIALCPLPTTTTKLPNE